MGLIILNQFLFYNTENIDTLPNADPFNLHLQIKSEKKRTPEEKHHTVTTFTD